MDSVEWYGTGRAWSTVIHLIEAGVAQFLKTFYQTFT